MRKRFVLAGILLLMLMCLPACGKKDQDKEKELPTSEGFTNDVVMRIGEEEISYAEANIYLLSMREEVEALYGEQIWDFKLTSDGKSYKEMMKDELLEKIIYIKLVCYMAKEFSVSLEADDILNINDYTQKYIAGISEDMAKKYGITEERVRAIYSDNVLAEKIYNTITLNAETDYSPDEVNKADFYYVFISKTYEDLEGNQVPVSEEECENRRQRAENYRAEALEAKDFYNYAKERSEASSVEMTVAKAELPKASAAAAFSLKEGEISPVVEEEDGFYLFYCKSEKNDLATQEAEEAIITEQSQQYFDSLYEKWRSNVEIQVNEALWDAM